MSPGRQRATGRVASRPSRARWLVPAALLLALGGCGEPSAPDPVRTVILLTVDTLRADAVAALVPGSAAPSPTPHMDALARASLQFPEARTCVPLTLPAHATMLTGLPPAATGVRVNTYGRLPAREERGFDLLQERLKAQGWRTGAFVSAKVLGARFGLDQGFDHYDDDFAGDLTELAIAERPGAETVERALAWLGAQPAAARCFLWVHLFEPHAPYLSDGTYMGDVAAADRAVGRLLDGLGGCDRSAAAVLLTSDHGEMLGDLGEPTHAILLADGVLRVPLLLRAPGLAPATRPDAALVADVAPTLAELAGLPLALSTEAGFGRSLLGSVPPLGERAVVAESLHAHHRYRWAQLLSATGPRGTLVDAGDGRLYLLAPAAPRRGHGGWTPVDAADPALAALGRHLAEYRALERPERMQQGAGSGGYGAGEVLPLLAPEANGQLPDPYRLVPLASDLDRIHAILRSPHATPRILRSQIDQLNSLKAGGQNASNPELAFLLGEGWFRLAEQEAQAGAAFEPALAQAEQAYLDAFRLGRRDSATLARACGANARGRESEALELLDALAPQVPHLGCDVWVLRARLHRALGQEQAAQEACEQARRACLDPKDRDRMRTTCR